MSMGFRDEPDKDVNVVSKTEYEALKKELDEKRKRLEELEPLDVLLKNLLNDYVKKGFVPPEIREIQRSLMYKADDLNKREEDLNYKARLVDEGKIELERRLTAPEEVKLKEQAERIGKLKQKIRHDEEELADREIYLNDKKNHLLLLEEGLIEDEIESRGEEFVMEMKQGKVKTGSPRLDDLLLGGFPLGSNVSIYGPAYVGKEVVVNCFIAEGLKKGIPAIQVLTDKTPKNVREEMSFVLPSYEHYEKSGLVKYVDAFSHSMNIQTEEPNTIYVTDATDHENILKSVDDIAKEFKEKHDYYRLGFKSLSTLVAYLDPSTTFRFLQPFAGRRKRDNAVSMYLMKKGMHEEQEVQMLGSIFDGMIEFKVEELKSWLSVKGITEVQSRAWIRYTYSKQNISIGSFQLDRVK